MSDDRASASTSTATGPAQARALRRSSLFDDPGTPDDVEAVPGGRVDRSGGDQGAAEVRGAVEASTIDDDTDDGTDEATGAAIDDGTELDADSARDVASAADQAARMSQLELRADGLLDRIRAADIAEPASVTAASSKGAPADGSTPSGDARARRSRWRR